MKKTAIITTAIVAVFLFASLAMADLSWTTKRGYFACLLKSDLDRVVSYSAAEDIEALRKMVKEEKTTIILKAGTKVYVEETDWSTVRIRPAGETFSVWTFSGAIEKQ